ncbi:MAG: response regulator transcription factor [Aquabacterium sp.]|uniref:response regulator transcription factor n=1 Tax=Aquabacterium sp. TaxID=1872578 RepID=UPI003BC84D68
MKRVLIVEDQLDIRELIRMTLEIEDLDIHEAENGTIGLEMAKQLRPDMLLLDIMMPGHVDGFEVCRQIKSTPELASTKVIFLSAKGQESDRQLGQSLGAEAYLTKPFSPRQLLEVVTKHLN